MKSSDEAHDAASTQVLSAILHEIGAIECLAAVVEHYDDDALKTLSKLKPERIAGKFGMALDKAIAFVGKCLEASGCSCLQLKHAGFSASELKAGSFDLASLIAAGHNASQLKSAAFTANDVKVAGQSVREMDGRCRS